MPKYDREWLLNKLFDADPRVTSKALNIAEDSTRIRQKIKEQSPRGRVELKRIAVESLNAAGGRKRVPVPRHVNTNRFKPKKLVKK